MPLLPYIQPKSGLLSTLVPGGIPESGGLTTQGRVVSGLLADYITGPTHRFYEANNTAVRQFLGGAPMSEEERRKLADAMVENMGETGTFIGAKGIANLGKTAILEEATRLKAAGVPDKSIWDKLGVTFGFADGKPRMEISDHEAIFPTVGEWSWGNRETIKQGDSTVGPVSDFMSHKELGMAYPGTTEGYDALGRRLTMRVMPDEMKSGSYGDGQINIGLFSPRDSGKTIRPSTAIHELQHAIQEREGFARGGSPSVNSWASQEQRPDLLKVAQQTMDEWKPASYETFWGKEITDEGMKAYNQYLKDFNSKEQQAIRWRAAQEGAPGKIYRNLAGEAEARLTQSRLNMTPEDRLASYPLSMFDVPVEQQIVRYK